MEFQRPIAFAFLTLFPLAGSLGEELRFNRDIRPILAANCFECHGPDAEAREADLRLDTPEGAKADLGGHFAIVPGDPDASELVARIRDEEDLMPPEDSNKSLRPEQKELLERWIREGATYEAHWGFEKPKRPALPEVSDPSWPRNPIDRFVLAQLDREELKPSAPADPYVLARRLYLDLVGLPPTIEEADRFVEAFAKDADAAVGALADELLASPHYGERWARPWLDLARYSDTNGYEKDRGRSIWPYRDWVIRALNADMPYDRFSIEQLAGDMLPDAAPEQIVATGFHRNTMINEEGGIDPLEFRFHALVDRVSTTGTVWLGMSTGCAQCHTHKYDPITHTDYYAMMALLDDADEIEFRYLSAEERARAEELREQITAKRKEVLEAGKAEESAFVSWIEKTRSGETRWQHLEPTEMETNLPLLAHEGDGVVFASGDFTKRDEYHLRYRLPDGEPITGIRLKTLPDPRLPEGKAGRTFYEGRKGLFFVSELGVLAGETKVAVSRAIDDFGSKGNAKNAPANVLDGNGSSGWTIDKDELDPHYLILQFAEPIPAGTEIEIDLLFERHFVSALGKFRLSATTATGELKPGKISPRLADTLFAEPPSEELRLHYLLGLEKNMPVATEFARLEKAIPQGDLTMVFDERDPTEGRDTHLRHRGEYTELRKAVEPAIPTVFGSLPAGAAADRLAFARWLVSESNPLAARVPVNRAWLAIFGRGIVETVDDFGVQAALPSHPDLLDWLAVEFLEQGQSMKALHRLLVTSATYRQTSKADSALIERDPKNELLARGPRFRVDGETVRDILLRASGLLHPKLGGPSVYPPQPPSVTALAYGGFKWPTSAGPDRYRRSLYTYSKRTAPFAAYLVFDAPTGEVCTARRGRSNTPLQALTLMNDEIFLEMLRHLGREIAADSDADVPSRIHTLFRRILTRPPTGEEVTVLHGFLDEQMARMASKELDPKVILDKKATSEEAAWTMLARVLANLDEAITKG